LAVASGIAAGLSLVWGEERLTVYFLFWLVAAMALAFAEWRGMLVGFTFASWVAGVLVMFSNLSPAFKASTVAMMAFLAYMVYRSFTRRG
jgi:ethanolamine utilization microcompartment shell protein EutL